MANKHYLQSKVLHIHNEVNGEFIASRTFKDSPPEIGETIEVGPPDNRISTIVVEVEKVPSTYTKYKVTVSITTAAIIGLLFNACNT